MSQKPALPPQNCNQETLGIARKPPKNLKKKPQVEWVVQLGPFTDGQISAPELVRPLEGPTDWVIRPKNGEIMPFDAGRPPEKDIIRKYITVGAQDNDVPDNLPKLSDGYVVDRVRQDIVPDLDSRVKPSEAPPGRLPEDRVISETITKTVTERIVEEGENPDPPECEPCKPCKPCDPPEPECKKPIDANNDHAETEKGCKVTIDVLKNDEGCAPLTITSAHAENGTVKVVDGKIEYTPKAGFTGNDVITYTISDGGCGTDEACVFVDVNPKHQPQPCDDTPSDCHNSCEPPPCSTPVVGNHCDKPIDPCKDAWEDRITHKDHEYSSSSSGSIFDSLASHGQSILDHKTELMNKLADLKNWSASCYAQQPCAPACPAPEDSCAVC